MDALKSLRGAHLPAEPSFWPPSLLLIFTIVAILGLLVFLTFWLIKKQKARLRPKLTREFYLLASFYEHHQSKEKLQADIGLLLRSVLLWHNNDQTLLSQELTALETSLGAIFKNRSALKEVLALVEKDRFKKVSSLDPEHLLLKTKELIASCRR